MQHRGRVMRLHEDFSICKIAGQSFLVPMGASVIDMDKMLDLNEVAEFIVNLIGPRDVKFEEIVTRILEEYESSQEQVEQDLSDFVQQGLQYGFITEALGT